MKSGILSKTDGFDLIVNDIDRSFRDEKKHAVAAAFFLKEQRPKDKVQIRDRLDNTVMTVLENGTLG